MTSQEIRQQFLEFFRKKEHRIVPSSPVVPFDDPTLLFANAGMNQFKDVFLGIGRRDYTRAVDTQKCIRVSGKHNDLEEVGHDTYHHTFFEMLGNWSFGDYYKKEAIQWAWELLTVYRTDDEAFNFWKDMTDINPDHILRFDEKDNFWEMGETGPCGPCSEIHINLTSDDFNNSKYVNAGVPECIEIWNLVFIQYNRDENGTLHELPKKHVDTGMGFERVCAVLQKKNSNYETDVFMPIINEISKISGISFSKEEDKIPMRVISDHVRALAFAIADGAVPGNEGRGYVLRRILRRAARYGRKLNLKEPFIYKLVNTLVENMSSIFPEIKQNQKNIEKIIKAEEESFNITLDRGIEIFEGIEKELLKKKKKLIPGDEAFKLYDTFGFPLDLTSLMAREKGLSVDEKKFNELMEEQKERARKSAKDKFVQANIEINDLSGFEMENDVPTLFTGYEELKSGARLTGFKKDDGKAYLILDRSPFYVESGGQTDDKGYLLIDDNQLKVIALAKVDNRIIHIVENKNNLSFKTGVKVEAAVDEVRRWDIMRNHSATHFLHAALRQVLGNHVRQAGSYVGPDRLRFDFTHYQKLSDKEINEIEKIVNEKLRQNLEMKHYKDTPFEKAKKMGALMFFGDKYGDKVNVVQFGDYTMEFCGGTHVKNSSQIGLFKIISESSIAGGVRRIEAVTAAGVEKYIRDQMKRLKEADDKIEKLFDEKKKLEKELSELKLKEKLGGINEIISSPSKAGDVNIYKGEVNAQNMDELKSMGDELRDKMKNGIGLLISKIEEKAGMVCVVSDNLVKDKKLSAGKIVGEVAKILGGGGGGRPHLATAGGKDVSKIDTALNDFDDIVAGFLKH